MSELSNAGSLRARVLLEAVDEHEITIREFASAAEGIPSEVLQVASTVLALNWDEDPDQVRRLWGARLICRRIAESHRCRN